MQIKSFTMLVLISVLFTFNCTKIFAQEKLKRPSKKNHFYLELFGNGIFYSANYERLISDSFTLRAGIGIMPAILGEGALVGIPISTSFLVGGDAHKIEMGIGATYFALQDVALFSFPEENKSFIALTGILGYRYFKPRGGFTFRICFTPLYNPSESEAVPFGGISFGYGF